MAPSSTAYSWIISTPDLKECIQVGCIIPGDYNDHSAYRGEICEQLGIAFFFHHFYPPENYPNPPSTIMSSTDCLLCIGRLSTSPEFLSPPTNIWTWFPLSQIFGLPTPSPQHDNMFMVTLMPLLVDH